MKKKVALVLGGTKNYSFALGNVLVGLSKFSPNIVDDVIIYHDGLSDQNKNTLNRLHKNVIFELYDKFIDLPHTKATLRFSRLAFSIYEIFDLLDLYEHIIWLDADTLILSDISDIINYGPIAMIPPGSSALLSDALGFLPTGFNPDLRTRNTGVVVVNDQFNYNGITANCISYTYKHINTLRLPDQGIITLCLALGGYNITDLPQQYNMTLNNTTAYPKIIHQAHPEKFWNHGVINAISPEWRENNEIYLKQGGEPYSGEVKEKAAASLAGSARNIIVFWDAYKILAHTILDELVFGIEKERVTKKELSYYIRWLSIGDKGRFELFMRGYRFFIKFYTNNKTMRKMLQANVPTIRNELQQFQIIETNKYTIVQSIQQMSFDKEQIKVFKETLYDLISAMEKICAPSTDGQ